MEVRPKKWHNVWFHLHDIQKNGKTIEMETIWWDYYKGTMWRNCWRWWPVLYDTRMMDINSMNLSKAIELYPVKSEFYCM